MNRSMIGRTIGRYEITGEIGRGGMGIVYQAIQTSLNRTVAVKMLPLAFAQTPELLGRFRREAETLARLSHENVVHVYDVEELDGNPFIVMELVAGPSLGQLLREGQPLPAAVVRDIGFAVASGLGAAHREGIVHRDIKPDNILFTPSGRPKLTDFGIARVDDARPVTQTGSMLGTPQYIAPEQASGGKADERSDVYSLGITLYEMAAGERPFRGNNAIEIYLKHLQEPVPSLADRVPGVPEGIAALITRCLDKDPAGRPVDGTALAHELESLDLGQIPGKALRDWFLTRPVSPGAKLHPTGSPPADLARTRVATPRPTAPATPPVTTIAPGPPTERPASRMGATDALHRHPRVVTAIGIGTLLVVLVFWLSRPGAEETTGTPLQQSPSVASPSIDTVDRAGIESPGAKAGERLVPTPDQIRRYRPQVFGLLASFAADLSGSGPRSAAERHTLTEEEGRRFGAALARLLGAYDSLRVSASAVDDIDFLAGPEARVRFRQELTIMLANGSERVQTLRHDWHVVPELDDWKIADGTVVAE